MGKRTKSVPAAAVKQHSSGKAKEVRIPSSDSDRRPSWRFSTVDKGGPFAWPAGEAVETEILQKLHSFDSMEWPAILGSDHHVIELSALSREAQKRLVDICFDDIAEVISFHASGKKRIIGVRDRNVVKLLWWDPEHQVCPSKLKNT